jgi:acetoin utilization protein AcuB
MDKSIQIKQIMTAKVVKVELDDKLSLLKEIFENLKFHHILVVDEGELLGIVSDRDLFKALSPNLGSSTENYKDVATLNKRVHQVMSRNPVSLNENATVNDAIALFNTRGVSCIPIVDKDNKPVGIVSWRDVMRNLHAVHVTQAAV